MTVQVILNLNENTNATGRFYSVSVIQEAIKHIRGGELLIEGNDENEGDSRVNLALVTHRATNFVIENNRLSATITAITGALLEGHPSGRIITCGTGKIKKDGTVMDYRFTKLYFTSDSEMKW